MIPFHILFIFRLLKVFKTHYSRSIYLVLICRHRKKYFHYFPFRLVKFFIYFYRCSKIDLFIQAIEMNPAVVSLKGYADVNRELLTAVIMRNTYMCLQARILSHVQFNFFAVNCNHRHLPDRVVTIQTLFNCSTVAAFSRSFD